MIEPCTVYHSEGAVNLTHSVAFSFVGRAGLFVFMFRERAPGGGFGSSQDHVLSPPSVLRTVAPAGLRALPVAALPRARTPRRQRRSGLRRGPTPRVGAESCGGSGLRCFRPGGRAVFGRPLLLRLGLLPALGSGHGGVRGSLRAAGSSDGAGPGGKRLNGIEREGREERELLFRREVLSHCVAL